MKINPNPPGNIYLQNKPNLNKKPPQNFERYISGKIELADSSKEPNEALPVRLSNCGLIKSNPYNELRLNNDNFKNFIKEAFLQINQDVIGEARHCIEDICHDPTGEYIDMDALDEWLTLCIENKEPKAHTKRDIL